MSRRGSKSCARCARSWRHGRTDAKAASSDRQFMPGGRRSASVRITGDRLSFSTRCRVLRKEIDDEFHDQREASPGGSSLPAVHNALVVEHQSQGHRHALPVVLGQCGFGWRNAIDPYAAAADAPGTALCRLRTRMEYHSDGTRPGDDLLYADAGTDGWVRQLVRAAYDRCARHGIS
jgi:hypothetical protein